MLDPMHSWAENLPLTKLLSLPPWILFKSTRRLSSLRNPTNLFDAVGITNKPSTLQSQATEYQVVQQNTDAESNITLNIERQIPGSSSNSNNARDGYQSYHAGAIHYEDEHEHKTYTAISKEDVLPSFKNTYCPVLRHTKTVLLNCQKARKQAHKITEFNPGKVTESTQHVSQRPQSLEIQDEGSQPPPKLYQVPQRRSNGSDSEVNQISSVTSNDDDWRRNVGCNNYVKQVNYEQRPKSVQSVLAPTKETNILTINRHTPDIGEFDENNTVTDCNSGTLVQNYSGLHQPMYTDEPACSNSNEQANVKVHIQNARVTIDDENTNSNTQQVDENIHISPNVLSATVIQQALGVAGLSLVLNNVRSVGFPNYFGLGDKTQVEIVFGWNHVKTRWDPFECWDKFKFRCKKRIKNADGFSDPDWLNVPQTQEESFSIILPPATDSASFKQGFDLDTHMSNLPNETESIDEFFDPNRPSSELRARIYVFPSSHKVQPLGLE